MFLALPSSHIGNGQLSFHGKRIKGDQIINYLKTRSVIECAKRCHNSDYSTCVIFSLCNNHGTLFCQLGKSQGTEIMEDDEDCNTYEMLYFIKNLN